MMNEITVNDKRFQSQSPDREFHAPVAQSVGPMEIMMAAVQRGAGKDELEILKGMFEFQKEVKAEEAKEAYYAAKAAFKAEVPAVVKDKKNKQYSSMYSSEDALFNTVNPVLAKHGLEASFSYPKHEDQKMFIVRCTLTHTLGHSEFVDADGPLDTSGSKNPLQQYKSTRTYLKKESYTAVTGIASADPVDDDGNGAGKSTEFVDKDQQKEINALLKKTKSDIPKFLAIYGAETVDTIPKSLYQAVMATLKLKNETIGLREPGSDDK